MLPTLSRMKDDLQHALDKINSARSSSESRTRALKNIETLLAKALGGGDDKEGIDSFMALQHTFECNVPSRLLPWLHLATSRLDTIVRGSIDESLETELNTLASQLACALSLLQGIALIHPSSKAFLGRKYPQEVLLELLLASRHIPAQSDDADTGVCKRLDADPPLTSLVLDTILCVLVDSSAALRVFEDTSGPQAVVRILKRAGTPREVRMKCLEFLYFYLLDETAPALSTPSPPPTTPNTPAARRSSKPYLTATPQRPGTSSSTCGSSSRRYAGSSTSSISSSRSTSGSSVLSLSSAASASSSATSIDSSPEKPYMSPSPLAKATVAPRPRSSDKLAVRQSESSTSTPPVRETPRRTPSNRSAISNTQSTGSLPVGPDTSTYRTTLSRVSGVKHTQSLASIPATPQRPRLSTVRASLAESEGDSSSNSSLQVDQDRDSTLGRSYRFPPPPPQQQQQRPPLQPLQPKAMMMLKKEVDFVPMSPLKKAGVAAVLSRAPGHTPKSKSAGVLGGSGNTSTSTSTSSTPGSSLRERTQVRPRGMSARTITEMSSSSAHAPPLHPQEAVGADDTGSNRGEASSTVSSRTSPRPLSAREAMGGGGKGPGWKRTTEEKKQLLGTMLGNVDALVEGVRKAGIWGLA